MKEEPKTVKEIRPMISNLECNRENIVKLRKYLTRMDVVSATEDIEDKAGLDRPLDILLSEIEKLISAELNRMNKAIDDAVVNL